MRAIYLASALLLSAFVFAPAHAAPAASMDSHVSGIEAGSAVVPAQYRRRDDRRHRDEREYRRDRHDRPYYRPGHRYRSAPHGWHRYDRRPRDWNRRGCILVGPIWFCP